MAEWSSGYVVDVDYTNGFYQELTPSLLGFMALLNGFQPPRFDGAKPAYCELGCGQGFSTNLLAAANPQIRFHATDFNPGHIAGARALAERGGLSNVQFYEDSFSEFLSRRDLPDFDYITLHGIYSWISAENRQAIVEFIRRKLKPGGLVYISYNSMPGWAGMMPIRRLLVEHASAQGPARSLPSRISDAIEFTSRLGTVGAGYLAGHPQLMSRLEGLKKKNPNYIAHEYFNRDFTPFYFMDVAQELSEAKLTWAGPANVAETIDMMHLSQEQSQFLSEIDNPALRQTFRDHIVNQQFRRDLFIKGPVKLHRKKAEDLWLGTRFVLSQKGSTIPHEVQGTRHKISLNPELRTTILDALEEGPRTLGDMMTVPAVSKHGFDRVVHGIKLLMAQSACHVCLPDVGLEDRRLRTSWFNKAVAEQSRYEQVFGHFASELTGGGLAIDRISQLIWLARYNREEDVPGFVWDILSNAGQRLLKNGEALKTDEENLAELRLRIAQFEESTVETWRSYVASA